MITLSSLAIPAYATSSSIQNGNTSALSTHGYSLGAMQDANSTGEALGLGWLPEDVPADARVTPVYAAALPTHFDWRSNSGSNWMTPVKNQGGCGSCVAFGAVGATEAQFKIQSGNPGWSLDLSEQHLFSCGGGSCSKGWYISAALNYLKNYGTPDESCSPYQAQSGGASCSNSCPDWQSRAFKIASWSWVANNPSALQAALMNGPLVAGFNVYTDFFSYRGGVYHYDGHSSLAGGHAIVIIGYDSNEQYWIVKNSWGAYWGESGYFRIGFGEAGIENYVASIRASIVTPPTLSVQVTQVNGLTVTVDGTVQPGVPGTSITRISWNWGDGTPSEDLWFPATRTYGQRGTYTVAVTAYQSDGQSTTRTLQVDLAYSRVSGTVAADTAGRLAMSAYPGGASTVYLAHLGGFSYDEEFHVVDALTAGSSVGNKSPVLLVPGVLDVAWKQVELDTTISYLNQLRPSQVIFLGSTGSISQHVEDYVRSHYAASYERISGTTAADTAGLLALRAYPGGSSTVYIGHLGGFTAADEFHIVDALTAGSSVGNSAPVLLVPGTMGPESWKKVEVDTTASYLQTLGASNVVILGSTGSITQEVEDYLKANYPATYSRVSGRVAADTAGQLALMAYPNGADTVYLAHLGGPTINEEFHVVDALTAGSSVGNTGPVLLVPGNLDASWKRTELDTTIYYLNQLHPTSIVFLGSTGSMSEEVEDYVRSHYGSSIPTSMPASTLRQPPSESFFFPSFLISAVEPRSHSDTYKGQEA
jgi:C1A family cysteine protease